MKSNWSSKYEVKINEFFDFLSEELCNVTVSKMEKVLLLCDMEVKILDPDNAELELHSF